MRISDWSSDVCASDAPNCKSPRSADPWLQSWKKVELLQQGRYVLLATWVTSATCSGVSSTMRNLLKYAPPFCSLPKVHPPVDAKLYSESPFIGLLSFADIDRKSTRLNSSH